MNERDERLERALRDVAAHVEYPATPALADAVRARIEQGPRPASRSPRRWQAVLVVGTAIAIVFGAVLAFSPRVREAVADFIGLGGVRIERGERPNDVSTPRDLGLGSPIALDDAEERVGFDVKLPQLEAVPHPEVYFTRPPGDGMVSLLYRDVYDDSTEPDLLITQFAADIDQGYVRKLLFEDADVDEVNVRRVRGYWVRGAHFFYYFEGPNEVGREKIRLATNVLLWEEDGITYRVEGGFGLDEALRVAASLR